jgi:hypothetical protein
MMMAPRFEHAPQHTQRGGYRIFPGSRTSCRWKSTALISAPATSAGFVFAGFVGFRAGPFLARQLPQYLLRLKREGNTFIAFASADGAVWSEYSRATVALPETVFFGLAVTAHTGNMTTVQSFICRTPASSLVLSESAGLRLLPHAASTGVLGLKTRQLNRDFTYPNGVTQNELAAWSHAGLFSKPAGGRKIPNLDKLAHHNHLTEPLEKRARSYIDTNCASCHRPGGVQALWDARYDTPLAEQGIVYGRGTNTLGIPDAKVVECRRISRNRSCTIA